MATSGEEESKPEYYYLPYENDKFEGVIVDDLSYYASIHALISFVDALVRSLDLWKTEGKKGVWLKIPTEFSQFVHPAIQAGFTYHHAAPYTEVLDAKTKNVERKSSYAMLVKWLPEKEENTLPGSASHYISAAAFILNEKKQMLAVREKFGKYKGVWKMPTGVIKQGEHIFEGIKREVKEETNIEAEFDEVIGFNEIHNPKAKIDGKSDVIFLCVLHKLPHSPDIEIQKSELTNAKWMSMEEFGAQEYLKKPEEVLLVKMLEASIEAAKAPGRKGFRLDNVHEGIKPRPKYFYNNSASGV